MHTMQAVIGKLSIDLILDFLDPDFLDPDFLDLDFLDLDFLDLDFLDLDFLDLDFLDLDFLDLDSLDLGILDLNLDEVDDHKPQANSGVKQALRSNSPTLKGGGFDRSHQSVIPLKTNYWIKINSLN